MPTADITVSAEILNTPRVDQVRGMFDLEAKPRSTLHWTVDLPIDRQAWNLGLIVGPSGCGKSTIAHKLWPQQIHANHHWDPSLSLLEGFPPSLPIKDIVEVLSSVGFSSPPAWLRPFHVLSTGQQFRVTLARLLAEAARGHCADGPDCPVHPPLVVFDEYTSVVDRTVAQIGSAAVARTIRKMQLQFVAVTCHEDVEPWLQPDWVYRPELNHFSWRSLQRRPPIRLVLTRCAPQVWSFFAQHHYLSHSLNLSASCFLATWNKRPVAFSAWLPFVGAGPLARREHRTVCLPDYQGAGIGNALTNTVAAMWKCFGYRAISTTTHPGMIAYRRRSPLWRMTRKPSLGNVEKARGYRNLKHATTRLTAGFEFIGPALPRPFALSLRGV